jgi:hypothetical protein
LHNNINPAAMLSTEQVPDPLTGVNAAKQSGARAPRVPKPAGRRTYRAIPRFYTYKMRALRAVLHDHFPVGAP